MSLVVSRSSPEVVCLGFQPPQNQDLHASLFHLEKPIASLRRGTRPSTMQDDDDSKGSTLAIHFLICQGSKKKPRYALRHVRHASFGGKKTGPGRDSHRLPSFSRACRRTRLLRINYAAITGLRVMQAVLIRRVIWSNSASTTSFGTCKEAPSYIVGYDPCVDHISVIVGGHIQSNACLKWPDSGFHGFNLKIRLAATIGHLGCANSIAPIRDMSLGVGDSRQAKQHRRNSQEVADDL